MWHHIYPCLEITDNEGYIAYALVRTDANGNHHTSLASVLDSGHYRFYDVTFTPEVLWIHGGTDRFAVGRNFSLVAVNEPKFVNTASLNLHTTAVLWDTVSIKTHKTDSWTVDAGQVIDVAIHIDGVKAPLVGTFTECDWNRITEGGFQTLLG